MRKLFDETKIKQMVLRNRFVRSATWEGMCEEDGRPTKKLADCYSALARGGVGLIISGYTFITPRGKQFPGQMGIHTDSFAPGMIKLTEAIHQEGGKVCMQLVHTGGQTTSAAAGCRPVAPSAIQVPQYSELPEELTLDDINELVSLFTEGARRAEEYGFDCIQLHASHGYLINQFLSPLTNRRTDAYGGTVENRSRFLLEVYQSIQAAVGKNFPVMIKLNGSDNLEGGLQIDDAVVAKLLDEEGVDAIEVSGGTPASGAFNPVRQKIETREQEAYNLPLAARIKNTVSCPVMVVGGLRSFELAEGIVRREEADYIAMSRPFIREPNLAARWKEGDESRARCISCNGCFKPGLKAGGIYCIVDKIEQASRNQSM